MWQTLMICALVFWDVCMLVYAIQFYRREKSRRPRLGVVRIGKYGYSSCLSLPILSLFFIGFTAFCRNRPALFRWAALFTCLMLTLVLLTMIQSRHDPISYNEDSFTFYDLFGRPHTYSYADILALRSWVSPRNGTVFYELYLPSRLFTITNLHSPDIDSFLLVLRIQYRKLHNGAELPSLPKNRPAPSPWDPFRGNLSRPKHFLLTVLLINLLICGMIPLSLRFPISDDDLITTRFTVAYYAEVDGDLILWPYGSADSDEEYRIYDFRTYMEVIPSWVDGGGGPITFELDAVYHYRYPQHYKITRMEGLDGTVYLSTERSIQQRQASQKESLQAIIPIILISLLFLNAIFFVQILVIRHPERYSPRMRRWWLPPDCIWKERYSAAETALHE